MDRKNVPSNPDVYFLGIGLGGLSAAFLVAARGLPRSSAMFPEVVAGLTLILVAVSLFLALKNPGTRENRGSTVQGLSPRTYWIVFLSCITPALLFLVGYVPACAIFSLGAIYNNSSVRKSPKVGATHFVALLAIVVLLWAALSQWLMLRLPTGVLWSAFS